VAFKVNIKFGMDYYFILNLMIILKFTTKRVRVKLALDMVYSVYYIFHHSTTRFLAGCAVGDLAGPIIISVCLEKVLHVDL
jgi:hypothetical protein